MHRVLYFVLILLVLTESKYVKVPATCSLDVPQIYNEIEPRLKHAVEMLNARFFRRGFGRDIGYDDKSQTSCSIMFNLSFTKFQTPIKTSEESYELKIETKQGKTQITIIPYSFRALFYGIGKLVRISQFLPSGILIPENLSEVQVPEFHVRGEQIPFRAVSNTWDAWNVSQMRDYYVDFLIFGMNTVEVIQPDSMYSPLFKILPEKMLPIMVSMANDYDLNVSLWNPFTGPNSIGNTWKNLTRLDALFVPGGDPGNTDPIALFQYLDPVIRNNLLVQFPNAEVWISNQYFNKTWNDEFYNIISNKKPFWLTGVVYGPHTRDSIEEFRRRIPKHIPIRLYPDACHLLMAQYPMNNWTAAFGLTAQREFVNPLPTHTHVSGRNLFPNSVGMVVYSDGSTADFNMVQWAEMSWSLKNFNVEKFVGEYVSSLMRPPVHVLPQVITALLHLEKNWEGTVENNPFIKRNVNLLDQIVNSINPVEFQTMWRLQILLYRAHYDAYEQQRWIREKESEKGALKILSEASKIGSLSAIAKASEILHVGSDQNWRNSNEHRIQSFNYAKILFDSVGMQFSVSLYFAAFLGRGDSLDTIDNNLNNIAFLLASFANISIIPSEPARVTALNSIVNWKHPTGDRNSFYDNLGDLSEQPHLLYGEGFEKDPMFYRSTLLVR